MAAGEAFGRSTPRHHSSSGRLLPPREQAKEPRWGGVRGRPASPRPPVAHQLDGLRDGSPRPPRRPGVPTPTGKREAPEG